MFFSFLSSCSEFQCKILPTYLAILCAQVVSVSPRASKWIWTTYKQATGKGVNTYTAVTSEPLQTLTRSICTWCLNDLIINEILQQKKPAGDTCNYPSPTLPARELNSVLPIGVNLSKNVTKIILKFNADVIVHISMASLTRYCEIR